MPAKMVDCGRHRAVLVTVYVERPRRKRPSSNGAGDRHHHYVHHSIRQEVTMRKLGEAGKGYDRRAELLLYAQRLRESGSPALDIDVVAETSPLEPEPKPTSSTNQKPPENIVAVQTKPKLTRTASSPTCPCFLPSFITKSLTSERTKKPKKKQQQQNGTTNKTMKAVMKSLQMPKKKRGFISQLFSRLQKKR